MGVSGSFRGSDKPRLAYERTLKGLATRFISALPESTDVQGRRALLVGLLVLAPSLAGCANDEPVSTGTSGGEPTGSGSPILSPTQPEEVRPRGTSERWHFHDYWKGNPTITLAELNLTLNATPQGGDGLPAVSAAFELPHGVIVPPETGFLTFNVSWDDPSGGVVNLTYRPADSNDFFVAGDIMRGVALVLNTTESMCDVPHRQASAWKFNVTAKPSADAPGLPPRDIKLSITATIGRPLFIDPPHLNWWRDGETIPLVVGASGELRTAQTPAGNATLPAPTSLVPTAGVPPEPALPAPDDFTQTYRVPVDGGRIVPEGTKTIVAMLNWTSTAPEGKLALRFVENNYPSEGALEIASDAAGSRIFVLKVAQAQTDTTYSNRTTWEFRVVPEGDTVAAFDGTFTLVAWASRLEPAAAVAQVTA